LLFADNARLQYIDQAAFQGCNHLASVSLPRSHVAIGDYSFSECWSLVHLDFGRRPALSSIGERAFGGCELMRDIIIPGRVRFVGVQALGAVQHVEWHLGHGLGVCDVPPAADFFSGTSGLGVCASRPLPPSE
jgi:hypothetical protein